MVFNEYYGDRVSRVKMEDGSKVFVFSNKRLSIEETRHEAEKKEEKRAVKVEETFTWDEIRGCYV